MNKMKYAIYFLFLLLISSPAFAQFDVAGQVTEGAVEVENARITLFNNNETLFFEERTNATGNYNFTAIPEGDYTIGATAINKSYVILPLNVSGNIQNVNFVLSDESHLGNWEIIMESPEPLGGTNLGILLPDGKIFYCHNTKDPFLFDPVINDTVFVIGDEDVQGCVAPALMPNGEMIFIGGADQEIYGPGTKLVKTFDPLTGSWEEQNDILDYRWYPTMTQLSDCKFLVAGGGGLDNPIRVKTTEVYDPETYTSQQVDDIEIGNEVSPIVLLYSGEALMTHRPPQLYYPNTAQWELAADFVQGDRMPNGDHSDHELVLLPDGRVVAVGYKSFDPSNYGTFIEIYDPLTNEWSLGESLLPIRSRAKTVLLPNKKILVMGGEKEDPNDPANTNQWNYMGLTDLYDPYTDSWHRLDDLNIKREYHCTTILVPDGRVIAIGGEGAPGNEPFMSVLEAFEPPYLFKGIRPEIHNLNKQEFLRGESIVFEIEKTNIPTSVILVSSQAVTHFMNTGNNRFLELDFIQIDNTINAIIPTDSLSAIPGYYMLFAMVDDIPSIAKIVKIEKGQIVTNTDVSPVQSAVNIFPNPTSNIIRISGIDKSTIEIYNASGQLMQSKNTTDKEVEINLNNYVSGVYFFNIKTSSFNRIYKVMKH
jgi:galactose oxidase-like protein/type IX secretion system substrate protein